MTKKLTSGRLRMIGGKSFDVEAPTRSCSLCQGDCAVAVVLLWTRVHGVNRALVYVCCWWLRSVKFGLIWFVTDDSEHSTTCVSGTTTLAKENSAAGTLTMSLFVMFRRSRGTTSSWISGWQSRKTTDRSLSFQYSLHTIQSALHNSTIARHTLHYHRPTIFQTVWTACKWRMKAREGFCLTYRFYQLCRLTWIYDCISIEYLNELLVFFL